jgi:branched-chain amino acid transport system ATP-binding protein
MLKTQGLTKKFGGLTAVSDLDLELEDREILGIIGPNGAGKTTAFNLISGFLRPTDGSVVFKEEDITGFKPHVIAKKGIIRTFQANVLFNELTVLESMRVGFHLKTGIGFFGSWLHNHDTMSKESGITERCLEYLDYFGIAGLKDEKAINLSHGHQRLLGIAIALASEPQIMLLDEPVSGMNPTEKRKTIGYVNRLRDEKQISIVIIEHDMKSVRELCDRVVVLNYGVKIAEGVPEGVMNDKGVIQAYLGIEDE